MLGVVVGNPPKSPAAPERGVPLVQVAAVHAAIAEGFAVSEVLACEGLAADDWGSADAAWRRRLAASPEELRAYQESFVERQDALQRSVTPLDDDLHAWLVFQHAQVTSPALADQLGMTNADVARLERRWRQRVDRDPALARRAREIADDLARRALGGETLHPAPVNLGQKRLVPSPATRHGHAAAEDDALAALETYAEIVATLRIAQALDGAPRGKGARAAALARHGLDEAGFVALEASWDARLAADPALQGVLATRAAHHERIARTRSADGPRATSEAAVPRAGGTTDMPDYIVLEPALPFVAPAEKRKAARGPRGTTKLPEHDPVAIERSGDEGATLDPDAELGGLPALPWDRPGAVVSGAVMTGGRSWDDYTPAQLASLHAELDLGLLDASAVRERYFLTSEQEQRTLEAHFEARFKRDPEEFREYRRARLRYRRQLER
jgi:hypothetical protein